MKEEHYRYFFSRLQNPAWLEPLRDTGFFKSPPEPIEEGQYIRFPRWPESEYLVRIAGEAPDEVLEVIKDIPSTENVRVYRDLIHAALAMPADRAAETAAAVVGWLSTSKFWLDMVADAAHKLMVYLAEHGETAAALRLLEALTEPEGRETSIPTVDGRPPHIWREAGPRYRPWFVRQLVEGSLPRLSKLDPLAVGDVLGMQLRKCMNIESRGLARGDASYIWRPAIEDNPQNWGLDDIKDILVVGLRDSMERAMSHAPYEVKPIIKGYLTDSLSVFRRLALHLIRLGHQHYRKLLLKVFQGREFLDDTVVHHEFSLLMRECFHELPEQSKKAFLDMVVAAPNLEGEGKPPLDELYRCHWVLGRLWLVREHLMPPYDSLLINLVDRFGKPEHPDFLSWHGPVWVGFASPKEKDELVKMSASEVLEYLRTFEPSGEPFDHSREGLARQLEDVVKEQPGDYAAIAPDFVNRGIHPTYVYHLVRGFHEAWKDGRELDWEAILALFDPISLALTNDAVRLVEAPLGIDDIGWSGVRAAIARFLAGALQRDDRALPVELMPRIRDILLRSMRDPEPTPEDERKQAESFMDWVTVRINSTRGVTAFALLEYARRYARLHKAEHSAVRETGAHPCRFEPEVKAAFSAMLDKTKEPSAAVHSIFGDRLPSFLYLDHDWTVANLDDIFPSDPEMRRYWEAAWEAYMLYCGRMYIEMYKLLRPQYWRAVRALAASEVSKVIKRTQHGLAYHLALAYKVKLEPLTAVSEERPIGFAKPETEGSLVDAFLGSASDEVRATAVRALGSELRPDEPIEDEDWQRLRKYWQARSIAAQTAPRARAFDQELGAFSSWLEAVPEGLDGLAPLLALTIDHLTLGHEANEVLAYLAKQSDQHPGLAVDLLHRLLDRQHAQDGIYLFGVEVQIRTILQNALPSDRTGRRKAISIINMLGERGEYGYRDLLSNSTIH
jgi:hypothetical protein